ncbi:type IV pilin protein [Vibrio alginolyticus]|uniref:type IV pilin protein n=1 Tax=Vibrio alginolyticus TaxID=663 RepID=UPI0006A62B35|nr:prepilin-type N-terminal cleavage/methylation domain-containing protein [Vibrio alginolyticus]EJS2609482.1 prepilin-type N-terminal cleavage/methylation domain-containing protein [Vibrio alginolyticus]EKY4212145.1 prepilin-type N-terminal cleavage/methylation domain-containing protein [Vibrio alginolyticus]ELA7819201.1 prepilin-type N-terminal cleavage/methylation domain-containing protein [Vibrio alginolyticus]ELH9638524.1 prepilin-type N-terminal cleavage/methylation domain-containing prot
MKHSKQKKQQGFTLIELMIVVAIIGVLSAVAVPAYKDYVTKSEVASGLATLKSIITPAELYYQENGAFPSTINDLNSVGVGSGSIKNGTLSLVSGGSGIQLALNSPSGAVVTISRDNNLGWVCSVSGVSVASAIPDSCS